MKMFFFGTWLGVIMPVIIVERSIKQKDPLFSPHICSSEKHFTVQVN